MHQYTADLANRQHAAGADVHVVTTQHFPRDRYAPDVGLHTPLATRNTGFSLDAVRPRDLSRLIRATCDLRPDLVHLTGPHLWNPLLMRALRREGVPTVHTLHDLHPHAGAVYGRLLYMWNGWVRRQAGHLLVHGQRYREELLALGSPPGRVTCTWLTHLFVGYATERELVQSPPHAAGAGGVSYEPWALTIGRLERYKGLDVLVEAARGLDRQPLRVVIAGPGRLEQVIGQPLPGNVEVRNRLVGDAEAVDLFCRCGLVVLPYTEASQSALVGAAHFFRKPVIVTRVGALPEYVTEGETGWVIPPNDAQALAAALRAALADPVRLARMGDAGWAWYQRQRQAEGAVLQEMYAGLETGI
jgi:glycosyltransferase involved in cell wall biosynthesis